MLRVAISGGIGSGKSAVTAMLRELGAKVVVADEVNAALLTERDYVDRIANIFPSAVHNHVIDKKELATIIYSSEEKRRLLMSVAHPMIYQRMFSAYAGEPLVFYEVPLLSECPHSFDRILFVAADYETRVAKIVARDGVDEARAKRVISLQSEEEKVRERADRVLLNRYDPDDLRKQVKEVYLSLLKELS